MNSCLLNTYPWGMLNERLKNLRLAKGLTLQQVGDVFGISAASVSSWEKGKNQPDSRKLSELAEILGSSVEFLLNGSGGVNPGKSEFLFEPVGFIEWAAISKSLKVKSSKKSVMPLHSKLGSSGFATRYPGSQELIWTQERIPAGALVFVDPDKELRPDSIVIVLVSKGKPELACVQFPTKTTGHFLKLLTSGDSHNTDDGVKIIGSIVEWRISGKL